MYLESATQRMEIQMTTLQINEDIIEARGLSGCQSKERVKTNNLLQQIEAYFSKPITNQEQKCREQTTSSYQFVWKLMPSIPVGRAINTARHRLVEAGITTAAYDAQIILAHVLQRDRDWVLANYEYELNEQQAILYTELIARRYINEPLNALLHA